MYRPGPAAVYRPVPSAVYRPGPAEYRPGPAAGRASVGPSAGLPKLAPKKAATRESSPRGVQCPVHPVPICNTSCIGGTRPSAPCAYVQHKLHRRHTRESFGTAAPGPSHRRRRTGPSESIRVAASPLCVLLRTRSLKRMRDNALTKRYEVIRKR
jgi:hypothetical protein